METFELSPPKATEAAVSVRAAEDVANDAFGESEQGTMADKRDMYRLGRKQVLKRRFKYFSIAGYIVVLGNTWEFAVVTSVFSLANGGPAGAIWTTIIVCIGMFFCVLSMAELASMAPTSGGQYHWVSEIAPPRAQKQVSYAVGWLAMLGWQVGLPAVSYIFASQLLALIAVCDPTYVPTAWHGALMTIATAVAAILLSIAILKKLTLAEGVAIGAHCLGFIAFLVILWVFGPNADAHETFFGFQDQNGWNSFGVATLVGIIGPVSTFIGGDSAVHLAEELQDAGYILPRAMVLGSGINYVVGAVGLISFMFNIGPLDDSIWRYASQPWVAVIYRITDSKAATIVMIIVVSINFFCLQINMVLTSSRQLWAFARDKGLPFHSFLARVGKDGVPRNALVISLAFTAVIALIVIGSSAAFNVILSFGNAGLYSSYIICLICLIYRRCDRSISLPATQFSLGKYGLVVNIISLCYLLVGFVFSMFPAVPNPAPVEMNWASLMFGAILLLAFIWYFVKARFEYDGPVEYVRKDFGHDLDHIS